MRECRDRERESGSTLVLLSPGHFGLYLFDLLRSRSHGESRVRLGQANAFVNYTGMNMLKASLATRVKPGRTRDDWVGHCFQSGPDGRCSCRTPGPCYGALEIFCAICCGGAEHTGGYRKGEKDIQSALLAHHQGSIVPRKIAQSVDADEGMVLRLLKACVALGLVEINQETEEYPKNTHYWLSSEYSGHLCF